MPLQEEYPTHPVMSDEDYGALSDMVESYGMAEVVWMLHNIAVDLDMEAAGPLYELAKFTDLSG